MDTKRYPEERRYLAKTVEFLDREIAKRKARSPARGPYKEDARTLQELDDKCIADYERIRPRPYFGRIDFSPEGDGELIKGYIGSDHIPPNRVYSWASPFAGQLFYAEPDAVNGWDAPKGRIRGEIILKRQFTIDDAKLLDVTEVYQLPSPDIPRPVEDPAKAFLIRQLSRPRGRKLGEAIATIQPEQYQQIAATPTDVMLIQGVAGSGKSIVGLHRIAYLLSPFHERRDIERIEPSQCVFFGPTRNFLRYVSNLLPSLNVRSVPQVAVADWLIKTITEAVKLDPRDPLLEKLLRFKGKRWQDAHHAARLKGSLQMARTLDRYVDARRKEILAKASGVAVRIDSVTPLILDARRVHREAASALVGPLNVQRRAFIVRLTSLIWDLYFRANPKLGERARRQKQQQVGQRVRLQVQRQVSEFWPRLDSRQEYRTLLSSPGKTWGASRGQLSPQERGVLARSIPPGTQLLAVEDLGPLCYLDHQLNEHRYGEFHHVVLDEAQEVSPIELQEMMRHTRGNGFTVLGDLTQSLSPLGNKRLARNIAALPW